MAQARKRKRSDYKRWERARAMELWQMDIVGGVRLAEGSEAKIVSGIDDHSRFVISAAVVERATARPVCDALEAAIARQQVGKFSPADKVPCPICPVRQRSRRPE
jgi:transposase InsO family protein